MAEHNRQLTVEGPHLGHTRATILVTLIDLTGKITDASFSYQVLLGYEPSSLLGRLFTDLIHPNDLRNGQIHLTQTQSTNAGMEAGWVRFRHAQGSWVWLEVSGPLIIDQGTPMLIFIACAVDADSHSAEQYHAVAHLESIRHLTRKLAHDINNLLTGISGFANLALQTLPERHAGHDDLEQIRRATTRAAALVHQLRLVWRDVVPAPQVVQLNELLRTMVPFLSDLIGTEIELTILLTPDLGSVRADPAEIELVIAGLVISANDLLSSGGRIVMKTAKTVLPAPPAHPSGQRVQGDYVMLAVHVITTLNAHMRGYELDGMYTRIIEQFGGLIRIVHDSAWETGIMLYLPRISLPEILSQRFP